MRQQTIKSTPTYTHSHALPQSSPPPDKPLPSRPPPRSRHNDTAISVSSRSFASTFTPPPPNPRHSAPIGPLTLPTPPRPRPDSTILPLSPPLQHPSPLASRDFHALVRRGDVLQYWLPVAKVLRGEPGREALPRGHWESVVRLAENVAVGEDGVQLVTGWCSFDEPLGDDDGEGQGGVVMRTQGKEATMS